MRTIWKPLSNESKRDDSIELFRFFVFGKENIRVKQLIVVVFILILSSGCGTNYVIKNPGGGVTKQQAHKDDYECRQEASRREAYIYGNLKQAESTVRVDKHMLFSCLRARGYEVEEQ